MTTTIRPWELSTPEPIETIGARCWSVYRTEETAVTELGRNLTRTAALHLVDAHPGSHAALAPLFRSVR